MPMIKIKRKPKSQKKKEGKGIPEPKRIKLKTYQKRTPQGKRIKISKKPKGAKPLEDTLFREYMRTATLEEAENFFLPVGSPAECSPELCRVMCFYLSHFIPVHDACFLLGIFENTHYRWMKAGKDFVASYEDDWEEKASKSHKKYAYYYLAINRALALFRKKIITRSLAPDKFVPTWVRDITILERRDKNTWAKATDVGLTTEDAYDPDEAFL